MTGKNIPHRAKSLVCLILVILALFVIAGCGGGDGGGGGDIDPSNATVSGYVVKDYGGEALSGSSITTTQKSKAPASRAISGSNGIYTFSTAAGTYDIIGEKEGRASFKVQDITLEAGKSYTANMVQKPVFNSDWSTTPPTVTSIEGITSGVNPSGTVNIVVNTSSANPMRRIELRIGNMDSAPDALSSNSSTLSYEWNTDSYPASGENNFIDIIAMDVNYNITRKTVYFNQSSQTTTLDAPDEAMAYAVTYPYTIRGYYKEITDRTKKSQKEIDEKILKLPRGFSPDLKTAPADAWMVTMLTWTEVPGADGYVIYRKLKDEGTYKIIGSSVSGDYVYYYDYDPALTVGTAYQYAVAPYNADGTGQKKETPSTTFLDRFSVQQDTPVNNAVDVSLNPQYKWSASNYPGDKQFYLLSIWGYNDGYPVYYSELDSITQFSSGPTLIPNTVYVWNIESATAAGSYNQTYDDYMAISLGSVSGSHVFTTQQ